MKLVFILSKEVISKYNYLESHLKKLENENILNQMKFQYQEWKRRAVILHPWVCALFAAGLLKTRWVPTLVPCMAPFPLQQDERNYHELQEKLGQLQAQVRMGGKGTAERRWFTEQLQQIFYRW